MKLNKFCGWIGAHSADYIREAVQQKFTPYEGGVFFLKWEGEAAPKHDYEYGFVGVEQDEQGKWYFVLENKEFTESKTLTPEKLAKIQEEYGVVYPRFPVEHSFSRSNGGPTEAFLLPPAASQAGAGEVVEAA